MVHGYENREPKTACFDYGLLTHVSEIKNNLGIDTCVVPKISGYIMQKHEDRHQLWAHALAIYGSDKVAFSLRTSKRKERKKSLTRGHVEDIGSTAGIQSYNEGVGINCWGHQ